MISFFYKYKNEVTKKKKWSHTPSLWTGQELFLRQLTEKKVSVGALLLLMVSLSLPFSPYPFLPLYWLQCRDLHSLRPLLFKAKKKGGACFRSGTPLTGLAVAVAEQSSIAPGRQLSAGTESHILALQLLHQREEGKDRAETEGAISQSKTG